MQVLMTVTHSEGYKKSNNEIFQDIFPQLFQLGEYNCPEIFCESAQQIVVLIQKMNKLLGFQNYNEMYCRCSLMALAYNMRDTS